MEKKIGKLNFCVALFAIMSVVIWFYTRFMGIFDSADIIDGGLRVAGIIYYACGLFAVAGLLWVIIVAIIDASKGKRNDPNLPFYGFAIFGMAQLVENLMFMQAVDAWGNPNLWVGVILGLFILGTALFAILFGGRALNIMGFVISAVLVGFFAFRAVGELGEMADYQQFFAYIIVAALFVFTALSYTKQLTKPLPQPEEEKTVKKVEKK